MVLEKTLESPLDFKEIQTVHPKGDQSWMFIGRTDVEAETPIVWPPDGKIWLIWKYPDAGKDWLREDKVVRWHHRLHGHEFESTPGAGDGQGGLACCSSWGLKESDMTERLNWLIPKDKPEWEVLIIWVLYVMGTVDSILHYSQEISTVSISNQEFSSVIISNDQPSIPELQS